MKRFPRLLEIEQQSKNKSTKTLVLNLIKKCFQNQRKLVTNSLNLSLDGENLKVLGNYISLSEAVIFFEKKIKQNYLIWKVHGMGIIVYSKER